MSAFTNGLARLGWPHASAFRSITVGAQRTQTVGGQASISIGSSQTTRVGGIGSSDATIAAKLSAMEQQISDLHSKMDALGQVINLLVIEVTILAK